MSQRLLSMIWRTSLIATLGILITVQGSVVLSAVEGADLENPRLADTLDIKLEIAKSPTSLWIGLEDGAGMACPLVEANRNGTTQLPICGDGPWLLQISGRDHWAPSLRLDRDSVLQTITLPLRPAAFVTVIPRLDEPALLDRASALSSRVLSDRMTTDLERFSTDQNCTDLLDGRWECKIPAGRSSAVRLAIPGRVPTYLWDVEMDAGQTLAVGERRFPIGSSLAGWVEKELRDEEDTQIRLTLAPKVEGCLGDPRTGRRLDLINQSVIADRRGFFQLRGLQPGSFVLEARADGFVASRKVVRIPADGELLLGEPIFLARPLRLQAFLEPPNDMSGNSWQATLLQLDDQLRVMSSQDDVKVTPEGVLLVEGLTAGAYELIVKDEQGSSWLTRAIEIESPPETLFIEIPHVPIRGSVQLGEEALTHHWLSFGTTQGSVDVRLQTDDHGRFEGFLPREGLWPFEIVWDADAELSQAYDPVDVRKRPGKSFAEIEIELPDTRLTGVVLHRGQAVSNAFVTVVRGGEDRRREAVLATDHEGKFRLRGAKPGALMLMASDQEQRSSGWVQLDLGEDLDTDVELHLAARRSWLAFLHSDLGPIVGASVLAIYRTAVGREGGTQQLISGAEGELELLATEETHRVELVVVADGLPTALLGHDLPTTSAPLMIEIPRHGGDLLVKLLTSVPGGEQIDALYLSGNGLALPLRSLVTLLHQSQRVVFAEHQLRLPNLIPGAWQVCTFETCASGILMPNSQVEIPAPSSVHENAS